jgi:ribonuclease J
MNFKIHRGTKEIGGSCVEIWTDTTKIVIDIGMPLVELDGTQFNFASYQSLQTSELVQKGILPDIEGLYENSSSKVAGILISHYHQDHHGFLSFAASNIPVYIGEATQRILEFSQEFFKSEKLNKTFINFSKSKQFRIGDINITPYWMDHSAFDAYAFLIEANGKRLFYSGDFRGHGRKDKVFKRFLFKAPKNVDYLLMEGTTIGRGNLKFKTELEIEEDFVRVFKSKIGINLITTSAQNIDRLVTIYRACKKANKLMVVDVYTAAIMQEMSAYATIPFASKSFPEIKVMYPYYLSKMIADKMGKEFLYQFQPFKITKQEIAKRRNEIVFLIRPSMKLDIDRIEQIHDGNYIYSMWNGYLKQQKTKEFVDYLTAKGFTFHQIHTSGHADIDALKEMVAAIKPRYLVPIHTFEGDNYKSIFTDTLVRRVKDRENITID